MPQVIKHKKRNGKQPPQPKQDKTMIGNGTQPLDDKIGEFMWVLLRQQSAETAKVAEKQFSGHIFDRNQAVDWDVAKEYLFNSQYVQPHPKEISKTYALAWSELFRGIQDFTSHRKIPSARALSEHIQLDRLVSFDADSTHIPSSWRFNKAAHQHLIACSGLQVCKAALTAVFQDFEDNMKAASKQVEDSQRFLCDVDRARHYWYKVMEKDWDLKFLLRGW